MPTGEGGPQVLAERCRAVTAGRIAQGKAVRFLRCVHLPEQSSAILLFEAYDPAEVECVSADVLGGPALAVALGGTAATDEELTGRRRS